MDPECQLFDVLGVLAAGPRDRTLVAGRRANARICAGAGLCFIAGVEFYSRCRFGSRRIRGRLVLV